MMQKNDVFYSTDPSGDGVTYTLNTTTWAWEE